MNRRPFDPALPTDQFWLALSRADEATAIEALKNGAETAQCPRDWNDASHRAFMRGIYDRSASRVPYTNTISRRKSALVAAASLGLPAVTQWLLDHLPSPLDEKKQAVQSAHLRDALDMVFQRTKRPGGVPCRIQIADMLFLARPQAFLPRATEPLSLGGAPLAAAAPGAPALTDDAHEKWIKSLLREGLDFATLAPECLRWLTRTGILSEESVQLFASRAALKGMEHFWRESEAKSLAIQLRAWPNLADGFFAKKEELARHADTPQTLSSAGEKIAASHEMAKASCQLLDAVHELARTPQDAPLWQTASTPQECMDEATFCLAHGRFTEAIDALRRPLRIQRANPADLLMTALSPLFTHSPSIYLTANGAAIDSAALAGSRAALLDFCATPLRLAERAPSDQTPHAPNPDVHAQLVAWMGEEALVCFQNQAQCLFWQECLRPHAFHVREEIAGMRLEGNALILAGRWRVNNLFEAMDTQDKRFVLRQASLEHKTHALGTTEQSVREFRHQALSRTRWMERLVKAIAATAPRLRATGFLNELGDPSLNLCATENLSNWASEGRALSIEAAFRALPELREQVDFTRCVVAAIERGEALTAERLMASEWAPGSQVGRSQKSLNQLKAALSAGASIHETLIWHTQSNGAKRLTSDTAPYRHGSWERLCARVESLDFLNTVFDAAQPVPLTGQTLSPPSEAARADQPLPANRRRL